MKLGRRAATIFWLGVLLAIGAAITGVVFYFWPDPQHLERARNYSVGLCIFVALLLSSFPFLISYAQVISKGRQEQKLNSLASLSLSNTEYFKIAKRYLQALQPAEVANPDYRVPMLSLAFIVIFGCMMLLLGAFPEADTLFTRQTFLLGGWSGTKEYKPSDAAALKDLLEYQKGTLLAGGIAFVSAYVAVVRGLMDRVHNYDLYPMSYYYLGAQIVIAALMAMVIRHLLQPFPLSSELTLLMAFIIGFYIDPVLAGTLRMAASRLKFLAFQSEPAQESLPTDMNLLMIEGLSGDKIDRLKELGIDNAQILAEQNPFLLWPRLPYSLILLVDWIAQAQLYVLAKENGVKKLREKGIRTVFGLHTAFSAAADGKVVAAMLEWDESAVASRLASLDADPAFKHLCEVRANL